MPRKSVGRFEFDDEASDRFLESVITAIKESEHADIEPFEFERGGVLYEVVE